MSYATVDDTTTEIPSLKQEPKRVFIRIGSLFHGGRWHPLEHVFGWYYGQENSFLDRLTKSIERPDSPYSWYDGAVICMRMAPDLLKQADRLIRRYELAASNGEFSPEDSYC